MERWDVKDMVKGAINRSLEEAIFDIVNGTVREILRQDEISQKIHNLVKAEINDLFKGLNK